MSIFTEIEKRYGWNFIGAPTQLNGGFMHTMYKLETDCGIYALKLLNPFVMQRETAAENYAKAEEIELMLERRGLPILPALSFGGKKMQELDGAFFYLFDYFDGRSLKSSEVREHHCAAIGTTLANIHGIDKRVTSTDAPEMSINWRSYLEKLRQNDLRLYTVLRDSLPIIEESQSKGNLARKRLPGVLAICHNDMDCKNVLWKENEYRIIDLECLSYNNPFMELFEMALCWSGYEDCNIDFQLFQTFLQGYKTAGGELPADWETLYDCNNGRLEWLEYNFKRVLGIDCGEDEKEIGTEQVEKTIAHVLYYSRMKQQILEHCIG